MAVASIDVSDASDVTDEHVEGTVSNDDSNQLTLTPVDVYNVEALDSYINLLPQHADVHGVKGLLKKVEAAKFHNEQLDRLEQAITTSIKWINGERIPRQHVDDKTRVLKNAAKKFYNTMNTPSLRMQCELFNIDYNSYEDQSDIIAALVEKHLAMHNG